MSLSTLSTTTRVSSSSNPSIVGDNEAEAVVRVSASAQTHSFIQHFLSLYLVILIITSLFGVFGIRIHIHRISLLVYYIRSIQSEKDGCSFLLLDTLVVGFLVTVLQAKVWCRVFFIWCRKLA